VNRPRLASVLCLSLGAFSCDPFGLRPGAPEAPPASPPPLAEPAPPAPSAPPRPSSPETRLALHLAAYLAAEETGLSPGELALLAETIVQQARDSRLDPALVLAVIRIESGFDAFAVSPAGACGLMQILPATGEHLAGRLGLPWVGPRSLFDPVTNVKLGVAYLNELRERYGSLEMALAAYNWGPGRIDRFLADGDPVPGSYSTRVLRRSEERPPEGLGTS
jgi:soluble lytic murein transglycosylase-like protein